MRTVIVEDHELVAAQLKQSVEELGHPVIAMASSFSGAADVLMSRRDVELAFIDLMLGDDHDDASGALLVDLAASRAIQVVVTTALDTIPERLNGVALLTKPYSSDQLAAVLASLPKRPDAARYAM